MADEEKAYDQGLREGIALIGEIVNKQPGSEGVD
ncbi:ABC transporter periplasmic protein [Enterobacter cancerogenus]|uniref:ABC transporter periplasmic protein n=1 Tax=Enterobacter cancerogenus TaxID=69218 RepID=A0A484Y7N6_9ENTR|nr:ABC transporter periplasmic protein [Enterobacter cancerogenus]